MTRWVEIALVDVLSGWTSDGIMTAIRRGKRLFDIDGLVPIERCVHIVSIPIDTETRDGAKEAE